MYQKKPHMRIGTIVLTFASLASTGCMGQLQTPERYAQGLVVILPGIEGRSTANLNIAYGLDEGGVQSAIEIRDWGTPIPGGFLINLTDLERNHQEAEALQARITDYQRSYPGRPVHVIGHSGGAGIALLAMEKFAYDQKISSVILLAAAVSPRYDLRDAIRHTENGVYNFHSPFDRILLDIGTRMFGTMDRSHDASAGVNGFELPYQADKAMEAAYQAGLHQVKWNSSMLARANDGGHFGWTARPYVAQDIAPLLKTGHLAKGSAPGTNR